jgi:hypothetical protein
MARRCWTTTPGPISAAARRRDHAARQPRMPGTPAPAAARAAPLAGFHTRVELLGRTLAHPMLLAPVAYQRMAHPDGELASAMPPRRRAPGWCSAPRPACRWKLWRRPCRRPRSAGRCGSSCTCRPTAASRGTGAACRSGRLPGAGADRGRAVQGARDRERRAGLSACRRASARSTWPNAAPPAPCRWPAPSPAGHRPHLGRRGLAAGHHPAARAAQGRDAPGRCARLAAARAWPG